MQELRTMSFVFIILSHFSLLQAQSTYMVEPGDSTLSTAIKLAEPNDVLQLRSGGTYTITNESTFGEIHFPLTIEVEPGASEKAILQLGTGADPSKRYYFFNINDGASLTLKGLDICGLQNGTAVAASMIVFDARPNPAEAHIGNFVFEDCIFHDFKDYIIHGMKDDYARGLIQDSVFINNVTVFHAKHFLQYKHVSLRHLEMTNTTVYQLNGMALKIGKIGYRCVLENPNKPYIPISDETITPTGFIDHCTLDDMGDIHGHIQVDNAYQTFTISNCIISNQQQFSQPSIYFLDPFVDTATVVLNTCFWNCGPPNADIGGTNWYGYQFSDTVYKDPSYVNASSGDFTLPENSTLLHAGLNNDAIGDLRWAPEMNAAHEKGSLNNELDNFPNPFSVYTTINFFLESPSMVHIRIFNANGKLVCSLVNEYLNAGDHKVVWNANSYETGVYLYRFTSDDADLFGKMLHL